MRRFIALAAVLVLGWATPALANSSIDSGGEVDDSDAGGTPDVDRQLSDDSATFMVSYREDLTVVTERGGRPGSQAQCGFFDVETADEFSYAFTIVPTTPYERDTWFILHCWTPNGSPWGDGLPGFPIGYECCDPGMPGLTVVDDWDVAAFAVANIDFTIPAFEVSPEAEQVVGIPTWLAVTSPIDFAPVNAAAGPIWATATPVFREAVWNLGNGDELSCTDDVAVVWQPGVDDQTSNCTYTYITNLEGEPFAGEVTVFWDIYWESSELGGAGPQYWGEIEQTSAVEFNVRELQAAID